MRSLVFRTRVLRTATSSSLSAAFPPSAQTAGLLKAFQTDVPHAVNLLTKVSTNAPALMSLRQSASLPTMKEEDTKNAVTTIADYAAEDFVAMVSSYEALMIPVLEIDQRLAKIDEAVNTIKYQLAGVSTMEAAERTKLEEKKAELEKERKKEAQAALDYAARTFHPEMFNAMLSVLRVVTDPESVGKATAGVQLPALPDAYQYALRVMDDMRRCSVPQTPVTDFLIRAIVFGDNLQQNSHLLWCCIENPEKGDITFEPAYGETTSAHIFGMIERRHKVRIPADAEEHVSTDAYPRIQPPDYTDISPPESASHGEAGADGSDSSNGGAGAGSLIDRLVVKPLQNLRGRAATLVSEHAK
eukprot:TRINITY_DN70944_c0_g1_i1.p1 TRINITY_DN70944_c0_g1~~TRINITY_DN70944_c0_g1_i1.p1  ORF type:complete len:358 (-),score=102.01 TRINITY_DN70944_c0_g1_i1:35-1108(-)